MKFIKAFLFVLFLIPIKNFSQTPTDYLPASFHKERRDILRSKMPKNSVVIVFANPVRNRANDVDYVYHQDPNFYYLTGYREPNAVLLIFSESQTTTNGDVYDEMIFVQERNVRYEMWNGKRLGVKGVKSQLGFEHVFERKEFVNMTFDFQKFDKVFVKKFRDDYRDSYADNADLFNLVQSFKEKSFYNQIIKSVEDATIEQKLKKNIDFWFLDAQVGKLRGIKTKEELKLLTKAIRISAIGQIEVMKAMKPHLSETELQGIHEFVYKKYGAEYEGYPSIVGAGNNGCILHYIENNKTKVGNDLVLMDLGAEYRGYTADVTRTIPANGKFTPEQKAIYDIVLKAQEAGIAQYKIGVDFNLPKKEARKVINQGLFDLGIIKSIDEKHNYLPHGTSHHIGLDVHDPSKYKTFQENMVITMEPGIYIPEGSPCDKKWWGIAIRIEDDILVTKGNPINLSVEAPRTTEAIEKMMAKKSVLDEFILPDLDE